MKLGWALTAILLVFLLAIPITEAQDEENKVLEIINLHLPKNETYNRAVTLVPYAPHDIEYQVIKVNTTIRAIIVTIELPQILAVLQ